MGDGEISPIGTNRKSYLLEKNKTKRQTAGKITETDPELLKEKIKEKQTFGRPVGKQEKESEHYHDPY